MAVNTAPVKWAQRADSIYLTLDLPDVKDEQLKLTKDMLSFRQDYKYRRTHCKIVCSVFALACPPSPAVLFGQRVNSHALEKACPS